MENEKRHQEFYLLPSLITMTNIFFGYLSIFATHHEKYLLAAFFIISAAVMDALDGFTARITKTQSDFGVQIDSLADVVSFGLAPSFLLYSWGFRLTFPSGAAVFFSFIFLIAGILRLARYNILQKSNKGDRKFYTGLTIPSASLLFAAIVLCHPQPVGVRLYAFSLALLAVILSLCMISTIKYRNYLNFNFRQRIDLRTALFMAVIFSSLIIFPRIFLLFYISLNVISGPAIYAFNFLNKGLQKKLSRKRA